MPYPRKLLNPHEEIAVDLHPHWWYYARPVALLVFAIFVGLATLIVGPDGGSGRTALNWLSIVLILISVFWMIGRYAKWSTTNFVITSDRLIFREGVVAKRGVEIPLERVNTVHFNQSVFERIVGAGDLVIESGGEEGRQNFRDIRNPDRVQQSIHVQKEENDRRRFTIQGAVGGTDVASQLEKLEGLLDRGTITQSEFDSQKSKLLGG